MSSTRRPIAIAAAIATAAAIGATAFVLPATAAGGAAAAPAAEAPAPTPVIGGTLDWGVLESYRTYVTTIAQGEITVADGATKTDKGFRFGGATGQYDGTSHVVTAAFKGSVTFKSAAHRFEVKLANLRVDTGTKKLLVDVTRDGKLTADVPFADVAFGRGPMTDLVTTLTAEAGKLLGSDTYAGKTGDPLTAVLEFPPQPSPSPSTSTSASPSPSASPSKSASPSASVGSPAAEGPQQILGGKLAWGVKESFRNYVQGAGGTVTPADGAVANGDSFAFGGGKGTLDTKKQKLNASFAGNLRFQYAAHRIDMTFGNVRIDTEGATGTLVLDVKTATATQANVPFATLDLSKAEYKTKDGLLALDAVRTALTAEGAATFANDTNGSIYKAGDRVDDVNLTVSVDKDAVLPTSTPTTTATTPAAAGGSGGSVGGNLASTGAEIPAGALLGTSGAIVAAGAGAVYIARRRRTAQG
ncbi:HtaA domain-containing protein [Streptomyces sp. ISL-43]|uniref:HtaA domain-containing protein n=1 Tax=Streptomyces sp. ISL-43 TaxID=2819183 RepID=UPI001BE51EEE|nr:HtaA domain-containing protein [Streptomyces sp. ISL-43]MBT2449897.1 HtaA domain-containing protein [Streptomyces sp. ISL-43]